MRTKFILGLFALTLLSQTALAGPAKWQPMFELEGRANSDRSLVSPKFLVPLAQDQKSMVFTDIRARIDDNDSEEYNLGLGYRQITGDWVLGGYGFVDHLNSSNGFHYWQGTAGLEALSDVWDARINGYLPQSTKHDLGGTSALVISGGGAFGITGPSQERALPGMDAEIGYKLPIDVADFRVFGGGYYFDADDFDSVAGPKMRAEFTMDNRLFKAMPEGMQFTVGVQYQNDNAREGQTTALAQIRIPFGKVTPRKPNSTDGRMTTFIRRDIDIVAAEAASSTVMPATVTINNRQYSNIAGTIDGNTGNTASINNVITNAGTNSLVVFDGSAGAIAPAFFNGPLAGQAFVGGGASIVARAGNMTASGVLPGTRPTLNTNIISFNSGVTIKNMDVNSSGTSAIFSGAANWLIEDVVATTTVGGGYGVRLFFSDGTVMSNVTAASSVFAALGIENTDGVTLNNVTLTGADGIELGNSTGIVGAPDAIGTTTPCVDLGGNSGNSINFVGGGTCP